MKTCQHIQLLPERPNAEELADIKKSVKKKKRPAVNVGDHGGHAELGFFTVYFDDDIHIEWNLIGSDKKKHKYKDLCERADHETDRFKLGWLIGNIYTLNKLHDLEKLGVPNNERTLSEYARLTNWYEKHEKIWYQWAVAKT